MRIPLSSSVLISELRARLKGGTLARGAAVGILISGCGTAISFIVQILLARTLGPEQFGLYAYAMGWMALVLLPAKLDLDTAATRFVGAYAGNGEWGLAQGFIRRGAQLLITTSVAVSLAAALVMTTWRLSHGRAVEPLFWAACALLPISALMIYISSVLQGLRMVAASQVPLLIVRPILFGFGVLSIGAVTAGLVRADMALQVNIAATLAVLVLQWRFVAGALAPHDVPPSYETRAWLRVALGLLSVSIAQLVLSGQTDVVVVGTLLSKTEAGHYSVASQIASALMMGTTAIGLVAAPRIAQFHRAGDLHSLQRLITQVRWANLSITLPVLAVICLVGRPLLGLFGPTFRDAYPILVILCLGMIQGAAGGSTAGFLLTMTGHERAGAIIIGGAAVAYLALVALLAPRFGAVGVALSTAMAFLIRAVWLGRYVRRTLGVSLWSASVPHNATG